MHSTCWSERRVFVTGATGLVGSWLVRRLANARAKIVVLVRDADPQSVLFRDGLVREVSVVNGDLTDFSCLERAINEHEIDTVFHLGAQAIVGVAQRNPLDTFETNIRGTYLLLEACRQHSDRIRRIVIASSDKAYGDCRQLPYTEDMPPLGRAPYEASKSCADILSHSFARSYRLPIVIARCGNIYGGGDLNWSRLVPGTIDSFLRSQPPVIRSDGKYLRDYIYVEDAVSAYMAMAENAARSEVAGEAFNFGPNKPSSVLQVVSTIAEIIECQELAPIIRDEAKGEIRDQYLDSSKAREILQWSPEVDLREGLTRTIRWYRDYFKQSSARRTTGE